MQFNQNTVTRYEYKISLLSSALLSFESLENNIFFLSVSENGDDERRSSSRRNIRCINMNGARSMQKMKIFFSRSPRLRTERMFAYGEKMGDNK